MINFWRQGPCPRLLSQPSLQKSVADSLILTGPSPQSVPHHPSSETCACHPSGDWERPPPLPCTHSQPQACYHLLWCPYYSCDNIQHPTSSFDLGWDDTVRKQLQMKFHTYLWMWRLQISTRCNLFLLFKMRFLPYNMVHHFGFLTAKLLILMRAIIT